MLSDALWRRRFGSSPDIVGKTIPLDSGAYEVAGVMPPDFQYPIGAVRSTDLWVPYVVPQNEITRNPNDISIYLQSIARLKPAPDPPDKKMAGVAAGHSFSVESVY